MALNMPATSGNGSSSRSMTSRVGRDTQRESLRPSCTPICYILRYISAVLFCVAAPGFRLFLRPRAAALLLPTMKLGIPQLT